MPRACAGQRSLSHSRAKRRVMSKVVRGTQSKRALTVPTWMFSTASQVQHRRAPHAAKKAGCVSQHIYCTKILFNWESLFCLFCVVDDLSKHSKHVLFFEQLLLWPPCCRGSSLCTTCSQARHTCSACGPPTDWDRESPAQCTLPPPAPGVPPLVSAPPHFFSLTGL